MKALKLNCTILLVAALICSTATVFAQQENNEAIDEEIIIIEKTTDGSDVHVIELDDLEGLSDELQEKLKNIELEINEDFDFANQHTKVRIETKGENGDPVIIEWEGEGDIPEELKKEMEANGAYLHKRNHTHSFAFKSQNPSSNKACLGVKIGKTVVNENGVETVKGESEQGVTILDVIGDSGAEAAGLLQDDIITAVNGAAVTSIQDVLDALKPYDGGATVAIDYLRDQQPAQVNATLKACANKIKVEQHIGDFNGDMFEIKREINEAIESGAEGKTHSKRIIIIKSSSSDDDEVEEATSVPEDIIVKKEHVGHTVSTEEKTLELKELNVYPNPTAGVLNLEFEAEVAPTTIKVYDISGKEIYTETLTNFSGVYKKEINLADAPKGTLMLAVTQNAKTFTEKIMVQ